MSHCGHGTAEIAAACEVTDTIVNYWISGERKPGRPNRIKLKKKYGIEVSWWDAAPPVSAGDVLGKLKTRMLPGPSGPVEVVYEEGSVVVTSTKDVRDLASEYVENVRKFMRQVDGDKLLSLQERSRILRECATGLDKAGKITGASSEIAVSKILKSPAWTKLGKIIADAILAYEDPKVAAAVLRSVGEALKAAE